MTGSAGVVDFFSLVVSCYLVPLGGGPDVLADAPPDWRDRVAATLETFRTPDGGYGKTPGAPHGSTYTSFLVALACNCSTGRSRSPTDLLAFVRSRRRDDGGYVEISAMKRSGTNPTAAGVGLLQILGSLDDDRPRRHGRFPRGFALPLRGRSPCQRPHPGRRFALDLHRGWTLDQMGEAHRLDWEKLRAYAEECERPIGGFRGGLWDEETDVEYTFYGLGTLALAALLLD